MVRQPQRHPVVSLLRWAIYWVPVLFILVSALPLLGLLKMKKRFSFLSWLESLCVVVGITTATALALFIIIYI